MRLVTCLRTGWIIIDIALLSGTAGPFWTKAEQIHLLLAVRRSNRLDPIGVSANGDRFVITEKDLATSKPTALRNQPVVAPSPQSLARYLHFPQNVTDGHVLDALNLHRHKFPPMSHVVTAYHFM